MNQSITMQKLELTGHPLADFSPHTYDLNEVVADECPIARPSTQTAPFTENRISLRSPGENDVIKLRQARLIAHLLRAQNSDPANVQRYESLAEVYCIYIGDTPVDRRKYPIGRKENQILAVLSETSQEILRTELIDRVWGEDGAEERNVDAVVCNLRKFIRSVLFLPSDVDPIPSRGRGLNKMFRLDREVLKISTI